MLKLRPGRRAAIADPTIAAAENAKSLAERASAQILAVGPAWGGIGHTFEATVRLLREAGHAVDTYNAGTGRSELRAAISYLWRHRAQVRGRLIVAELGMTDVGVFWTTFLAMLLGHDTVLICHDPPGIVTHPGAAMLARRSRIGKAVAYRILAPAFDARLVAALVKRAGVAVVLSEPASVEMRQIGIREVLVAPHVLLRDASVTPPPESACYVLFAGYLGPSKGLDLLLEAWHRAAVSNLRLVIAGGTDENFQAWLDALNEQYSKDANRPVWLGGIPDEESFAEVIGSAAAVVLPYREAHPASGILVRAMCMGRCVIASRLGPFVAAIDDGESGLLFDAGDVDGLASALRRACDEPELRARLGAAARERAEDLFSAERYQAVLHEAVLRATDSRS